MDKAVCKKIFLIICMFIFPIFVNAGIVCNDGTVSRSCNDCHRGCCSRHGGCSSSSNYNSSSYQKNYSSTPTPTPTPVSTPTPSPTPTPTPKPTPTSTPTPPPTEKPSSNLKNSKEINSTIEENDNNPIGTLIGLSFLGGTGYLIYNKQKKKNQKSNSPKIKKMIKNNYCTSCGNKLKATDNFCTKCGKWIRKY